MNPRPVRAGVAGAAVLAATYAAVVGLASRSADHLADQATGDWYLLVPIVAAFGVQVGLLAELRRRRRLHRASMVAGGAGTAGSAAGMVACCAHHLADLAPFLGAAGVATFRYDQRVPLMLGGLAVNAVAIAVAAQLLRRLPAPPPKREAVSCAAA